MDGYLEPSKRQHGQVLGRAIKDVRGRLPLPVREARVRAALHQQIDERVLPPRHGLVQQCPLGRGAIADSESGPIAAAASSPFIPSTSSAGRISNMTRFSTDALGAAAF